MSKPTPEQQAAFDAKLAGYKFDTSEYVELPDMSTHYEGCFDTGRHHYACALQEVTRLQARVAELEGALEWAKPYVARLRDTAVIDQALKGGA